MNVTVIYGSDGGNTQTVARQIASRLQARLVNIRSASTADFEGCDLLILGSPTYGAGDLQTDWEEHVGTLAQADIANHVVALFGTGDQVLYPDTFVDAMGLLYDRVVAKGATIVGFTEAAGYDFSSSLACRDGKFVGLAIDQDNQPSKTSERITSWAAQLK